MSSPIWIVDPNADSRELAVLLAQVSQTPVLTSFDLPTSWRLFRIGGLPQTILLGSAPLISRKWDCWHQERQRRLPHSPTQTTEGWTHSQIKQLQPTISAWTQQWLQKGAVPIYTQTIETIN